MNETSDIESKGQGRSLACYWLLPVAGLLGFILLVVLAAVYDTFPGDEAALVAFQGLRTGWLDAAAIVITRSADPPVAFAVVTGVVAMLSLRRQWTAAAMLAFTLAPTLCHYLLKELAARPRPEYAIMGLDADSFSFPSGHAVFAAYFGGCLVYLAGGLIARIPLSRPFAKGVGGICWSIQILLAVWVLAVGASRVYLGVHWPSDIVGGFMLGGLALLIAISLKRQWPVASGHYVEAGRFPH